MRPGTAKRPAGLAISPLSFGSAFSLTRPRDLAAIDDDRRVLDDVFAVKKPVELEHRSHRPQYRPPMPDTLLQRLRARDLVLPDYRRRRSHQRRRDNVGHPRRPQRERSAATS